MKRVLLFLILVTLNHLAPSALGQTQLTGKGVEFEIIRIAGEKAYERELDLGLSEDEFRALREVRARLLRELMDQSLDVGRNVNLTQEEKRVELIAVMKKLNASAAEVLDELLTPKQKQIVLQKFFRDKVFISGLQEMFTNPDVVNFLQLTQEQSAKLLPMAREMDIDLQVQIRNLRLAQIEKLKEELKPEQIEMLNAILPKK